MENTQDGEGHGFCQARQAGDLLFCSGQIGLDADGAVPAQPEDQFAAAFAALSRVLARSRPSTWCNFGGGPGSSSGGLCGDV